MNYRAIETHHNGYRFRSRLEARWAVFFDALGIRYEYEKEGFDLEDAGRYLPDFWLPDLSLWLEVKGGDPSWDEVRKAQELYYAASEPGEWGVAFGIGEPYYGELRVFCFDSTDSSAGENWWHGCSWYCDGQVAAIMTQNLSSSREFLPRSVYSVSAMPSHDPYQLSSAAQQARSARFEHQDRARHQA
jgi:hypothetical protein